MTKRLVDIDDRLLEEAREALSTGTLKETVNRALAETVRLARSRQVTPDELMGLGELLEDLGDPGVMADAWR